MTSLTPPSHGHNSAAGCCPSVVTIVSSIAPETDGREFAGRCHCGSVRFTLRGPLRPLIICHCTDCYRLGGSSWTATSVPLPQFTLTDCAGTLAADDRISWYRSSSIARRGFCARCHSHMFYRPDKADTIAVAVGMLDSTEGLFVLGHIYTHQIPAACQFDTPLKCLSLSVRGTLTNETLRKAVGAWCGTDRSAAIEIRKEYGHISEWDTSVVTDMSELFAGKRDFDEDLSRWDTGNVQSMRFHTCVHASTMNTRAHMRVWMQARTSASHTYSACTHACLRTCLSVCLSACVPVHTCVYAHRCMFYCCESFNQPIGHWVTKSVTDMSGMFTNSTRFNCRLNWNISCVRSLNGMFANTEFNQPLDDWSTANVTDCRSMFAGASHFNQPLQSWNVANVCIMSYMFDGAEKFDHPLDAWSTANVTDCRSMFAGASSFNKPLGSWCTANLANISGMFSNATAFNQPLGSWDVSKVSSMSRCFFYAESFNQPLTWNTACVIDMREMFKGAACFNQDLTMWSASLLKDMTGMFDGAESFDQPASVRHLKSRSPPATAKIEDAEGATCSKFCGKCGIEHEQARKFCHSCGSKL